MPQTAQEKAIHANSKSNGNSNEVTFASMVKDDEQDTNNGTTDELARIQVDLLFALRKYFYFIFQ